MEGIVYKYCFIKFINYFDLSVLLFLRLSLILNNGVMFYGEMTQVSSCQFYLTPTSLYVYVLQVTKTTQLCFKIKKLLYEEAVLGSVYK